MGRVNIAVIYDPAALGFFVRIKFYLNPVSNGVEFIMNFGD